MAEELTLRVLTPTHLVLEEAVDFVVLRCVDGDKGILPNHEPWASRLDLGMLRAYQNKQLLHNLFVMGGTALVQGGTLTVLSEMAGGQKEVEAALQKLEAQLEARRQEEMRSSVDIQRAEVALRNALVHMDVSSYTVMNTPERPE